MLRLVDQLLQQNFLNDRRFAENYAAKWRNRGGPQLGDELAARGVPAELADEIVSRTHLPSLQELVIRAGPDLTSFGSDALRERFGDRVTIHELR